MIFDHYGFEEDGDPIEHLPEQVRGILGRRTPEMIARVKKLLVDALSRQDPFQRTAVAVEAQGADSIFLIRARRS